MGLWALFGPCVVPDQAGSAAQMPVQTAAPGLLLRKQNMLSHLGNATIVLTVNEISQMPGTFLSSAQDSISTA